MNKDNVMQLGKRLATSVATMVLSNLAYKGITDGASALLARRRQRKQEQDEYDQWVLEQNRKDNSNNEGDEEEAE